MKILLSLFLLFGGLVGHAQALPAVQTALSDDAFIADVEARTFRYFWETTSSENGLAPDRYPTSSPASIAATGFALTAYPIGIERGYITREEGLERTLRTLRFLANASEGHGVKGSSGYRGFFYHFLDMKTGARAWDSELSSVDTALLLGGVLFCQSYFNKEDPTEREVRALAETIYARVDWEWMSVRDPAVALAWTPEEGFSPYDWHGYNEAMLLYVLALGSPTHPVSANAWSAWSDGYLRDPSRLAFPTLFVHQYSHAWIDFRGITDPAMKELGGDYFANSVRAVHAQRAYAKKNPSGWKGIGENVWGFTASDGPGNIMKRLGTKLCRFQAYAARGAREGLDDGTIAPTAALASIAFVPESAVAAGKEMLRRYGEHVFGPYGFFDAFNPTLDTVGVRLSHGKIIGGLGWFDTDYLGIDQGPILAMIENHRSGLVWRIMRKNTHIIQGLRRAGFTGGWLNNSDPS